jgi:hypothetical protein
VEERVTGEYLFPVLAQPVVQGPLLDGGRVQLVPHLRAAPRWPQAGQPQLGGVAVGDHLERVELAGVVPGHHDRDLESGKTRVGQSLHRPQGRPVRPGAPHLVVDLFGSAVE